MSVPNIKILSQAVSEKSLTEKKVNTVTEKAKTIYPLYTSHAGGINIFLNKIEKSASQSMVNMLSY